MSKFVYKTGNNHLKYFNNGLLHKNIVNNDNIEEDNSDKNSEINDEKPKYNKKKKK